MPNEAAAAWAALDAHAKTPLHLRDLLAAPGRFEGCSLRLPGLLIDYSRQRVNAETLLLLQNLARATDVEGWRDKMFSGEKINTSENRAVLHTALRRPSSDEIFVDGEDIMPGIHHTLDRMKKFCGRIHDGSWRGHTGKVIDTVVNIGIGGSDLGPRMVVRALQDFRIKGIATHYVSNIDGADLYPLLQTLDPDSTLFLIASKTFTTQETMANAAAAREWAVSHFRDHAAISKHFAALSTNLDAVRAFGISGENMFPFGEWVGGRYSLWSSIGLSIALAVGFDKFLMLLDGAREMDRHFLSAPPEKNAPVLLALLGLWNRNLLGCGAQAIIPYSQNLALLPAWMQQLDMESNGKSVKRDGAPVDRATGPVIFGTPGTDCQHSFFQLIHQGADIVPCDFIACQHPNHPWPDHHQMLLANMVAQADGLAAGRTLTEAGNDPQRAFSGNRPSTILLLNELTPWSVGQLLALYEHKVFVQGIIWGINSFDQWGVELGKILANENISILKNLRESAVSNVLNHIKMHALN